MAKERIMPDLIWAFLRKTLSALVMVIGLSAIFLASGSIFASLEPVGHFHHTGAREPKYWFMIIDLALFVAVLENWLAKLRLLSQTSWDFNPVQTLPDAQQALESEWRLKSLLSLGLTPLILGGFLGYCLCMTTLEHGSNYWHELARLTLRQIQGPGLFLLILSFNWYYYQLLEKVGREWLVFAICGESLQAQDDDSGWMQSG
jgi:hypothetical protein